MLLGRRRLIVHAALEQCRHPQKARSLRLILILPKVLTSNKLSMIPLPHWVSMLLDQDVLCKLTTPISKKVQTARLPESQQPHQMWYLFSLALYTTQHSTPTILIPGILRQPVSFLSSFFFFFSFLSSSFKQIPPRSPSMDELHIIIASWPQNQLQGILIP